MPGTQVNLALEVLIGFLYGCDPSLFLYGSNLEYWRELAVFVVAKCGLKGLLVKAGMSQNKAEPAKWMVPILIPNMNPQKNLFWVHATHIYKALW